MENKKTKEEKRRDWQNFVAKLKNLPPEKLSKAAKWVLKDEEKGKEDNAIGRTCAYIEENYVGENFYIEAPEIEGYKVVGDSKVKATFVEGELVIEAKYEKIQEEVNIDTGDIAVIAIVCVAVVCVAGIVYVVIRNKKKSSK